MIAGHTDNVPEKGNGRYQSNWDLSSARAINVMEYFISKGAVLEKNAAIQAFADTEPKADNNTPQGRSEKSSCRDDHPADRNGSLTSNNCL